MKTFVEEYCKDSHRKTTKTSLSETIIAHNVIHGKIIEFITIPYKKYYEEAEKEKYAKEVYNKILSMIHFSLKCKNDVPNMMYTRYGTNECNGLPVNIELEYKEVNYAHILKDLRGLRIYNLHHFKEQPILAGYFEKTFKDHLAKNMLPNVKDFRRMCFNYKEGKIASIFKIEIHFTEIHYEKPLDYENHVYDFKFVRRIKVIPHT